MKSFFIKLGIKKAVALITLIAVIISSVVSTIIYYLFPEGSNLPLIIVTVLTPIIVTPIVGFPVVRMLHQIHQLQIETKLLATYDALTKLLNRRVFLERTEYALNLARREKQHFCILVADVDFFKNINDQFGHLVGDEVLVALGQIIKKISRDSDIAGRVGGEEFSFFLSNTTKFEAENFAERLHQAVREATIMAKGTPIQFTISIGLASFSHNNTSNLQNLLHFADIALYQAKRNGRNQTVMSEGL